MNWEISVSRPGIYDEIERILPEMAAEGPMGGELAAGVGPKNDFWGAIPVGFFKYVLGIPVVSYTPYPIRKKITAERDKLVREWCPNDVGLELYTNVQGCKERRNPVDLCSGGSIPEQSEEESLEKLTVPKLRKMLEDAGIEIKGRPKKADLIELIREIVG